MVSVEKINLILDISRKIYMLHIFTQYSLTKHCNIREANTMEVTDNQIEIITLYLQHRKLLEKELEIAKKK